MILNLKNITLLNIIPLITVLLTATGCSLFDYADNYSDALENQTTLEKLIEGQDYYKAIVYLDKIKPSLTNDTYDSLSRRTTSLISKFENETEQKAVTLAERGDLLGAITSIERALDKIPESAKLLYLNKLYGQERSKKMAEHKRKLTLSEAEYLFAKLTYYDEMAKLKQLSVTMRWQKNRTEKSLKNLYPELLNCGQQALDLNQAKIASDCLSMANRVLKKVKYLKKSRQKTGNQ